LALAAETRADRAGFGIALMLTAWAFFALTDTSVKWLVLAGLPAMQLAFFRYFVSFLISAGIAVRHGTVLPSASRRNLALVVLRGMLLVLATVLNFIALNYLPLSVTSSIMNSSPILVTLMAVPLLGEKVGPFRWAAVVTGFAGVLLVIRPFGADFHWASVLIFLNAICLALFAILTRKLSGTIPTQTMQLAMGALGSVVLLPFAIATWRTPQTPLDLALMLGLGLWAWAGHEIFARAHAFAPTNVLMPFAYSSILYLTTASYLVFGSVPDRATLLGAGVIVGSGLTIWWREQMRRAPR